MWVSPTRECPLHTWVSPTRECPSTIEECYTWGHYRACEPHVSCTWGAPLHHWGNATHEGVTVHVSHTWVVHEGLPPPLRKCYTWGHYRAMWATRELYVRGSPPPLRNATREGITMHVSHTWAVHDGLPSTTEGMLHVRALPCMWATRELYMRGSPPPLRKCYMWGHYRAREPHVSCTWGAPLHHWGNATREGITMHVSHTWAVHEGLPSTIWGNATREGITVHVSHMWAVHEGLPSTIEGMLHVRALPCMWATREMYMRAPLHHWGNATREGITVHVSHTWAVREGLPSPVRECYTWGHYRACEPHVTHVYAHSSPPPSKKSDQKTARQHIGSSDEPPKTEIS